MKTCTSCRQAKPDTEFHWANTRRTYRRGDCKTCCLTKQKARAKADPQRHSVSRRYIQIKHKYGLAPDDADDMLEQQEYRCAICSVGVNLFSHVDHDHRSGRVRGFLCAGCNWLLGHGGDDPRRLRAAADYLEVSSSTSSS